MEANELEERHGSHEELLHPILYALNVYTGKILGSVKEKGTGEENDFKSMRRRALEDFIDIVTGEASEGALRRALEVTSKLAAEVYEGFKAVGCIVSGVYLVLRSQGLVGAGGGLLKPVFEVGLNIHPQLGVPYYPGSGIKGAVRSLVSSVCHDSEDLQDWLLTLFGSSDESVKQESEGRRRGGLIFADALPVGRESKGPLYFPTVLTPHYHRDGEPVDNELDVVPNPVSHLSIAEGVVFSFIACAENDEEVWKALVAAGSCIASRNGEEGLVERLEGNPALALAYLLTVTGVHGLGARSMRGYNLFYPYTNDRVDPSNVTAVQLPSKHLSEGQHGRSSKQLVGNRYNRPRRERGAKRWMRQ